MRLNNLKEGVVTCAPDYPTYDNLSKNTVRDCMTVAPGTCDENGDINFDPSYGGFCQSDHTLYDTMVGEGLYTQPVCWKGTQDPQGNEIGSDFNYGVPYANKNSDGSVPNGCRPGYAVGGAYDKNHGQHGVGMFCSRNGSMDQDGSDCNLAYGGFVGNCNYTGKGMGPFPLSNANAGTGKFNPNTFFCPFETSLATTYDGNDSGICLTSAF